MKKINLNDIEALKSPTNRRYNDSALIASFAIEVEGKKYTSSTFDAGSPPIELKKLEDLLYSFIKINE
ncbi:MULTISPECIES: hypothetical protein [unclassified Tenacibaculum]|uniref:hypothetical protein n=1 Tax=unclassified Tenacibaculum TaxID=2635139 RepID=UPI001F3CD301|nr:MULTISPECIES: hypothetical protein [unclassified Tenacibaculum]MCF2874548.1 hypothetical protein [Tenacibaculum sp. Cn5-1]MCF2934386.1 hypothetical protein [Tenacibaculum sp. Cn5-34]MCG7510596.1 hypothetical protein [Tenacibaculum sp. Cn5-46]